MFSKSIKSISYLITSTTGLLSLQEVFTGVELYILLALLLIGIILVYYSIKLMKTNGMKVFLKSSCFSWMIITVICTVILSTNYYINYKNSIPLIAPPDFQHEMTLTPESIHENSKTPSGKFALGQLYYTGIENAVMPDYHKAKKWFKEAAEDDYPEAHYYLGMMYYKGQGGECDYNTALLHFKNAANYDLLEAHKMLALMYQNGYGTKVDIRKTIEFLLLPAEQGDLNAQENLGALYLSVHKKDSANYWNLLAAHQGSVSAYSLLIFHHIGGDEKADANNPDLATYIPGLKTSAKYAKELIKINEVEGNYWLGFVNEIGGDNAKAIEYYRKAAINEHALAQLQLAKYFSEGKVPSNLTEAIEWCQRAIRNKNVDAQNLLPVLLERKINSDGSTHN